jgi:ElaB/YqjD/DUF883 family membrane-anchored ribosome-binding protein
MANVDLRAEVASLRKEVEKLGELVELVSEKEAHPAPRRRVANGSSRVRKTLDAARAYGKRAVEGIESGIEARPWIGVAVALAIGVVLGRSLLTRRDRV